MHALISNRATSAPVGIYSHQSNNPNHYYFYGHLNIDLVYDQKKDKNFDLAYV